MSGLLASRAGRIASSQPLGPPILRADTFDRANQTNLGTPSDGGAAWAGTTGDFAIASNKAAAQNANFRWFVLDCAATITEVDVTVSTGANGSNCEFAVADSSGNGYCFELNGSAPNFFVRKIVNSSIVADTAINFSGSSLVTGLTNVSAYYPGSHAWKITRTSGGAYAVTFDGAAITSFTDTSYVPTRVAVAATSSMGYAIDSLTVYG